MRSLYPNGTSFVYVGVHFRRGDYMGGAVTQASKIIKNHASKLIFTAVVFTGGSLSIANGPIPEKGLSKFFYKGSRYITIEIIE